MPFLRAETGLTDSLAQYEIEGWTGFNFPGRKGKYSDMVWSHIHFVNCLPVDVMARSRLDHPS